MSSSDSSDDSGSGCGLIIGLVLLVAIPANLSRCQSDASVKHRVLSGVDSGSLMKNCSRYSSTECAPLYLCPALAKRVSSMHIDKDAQLFEERTGGVEIRGTSNHFQKWVLMAAAQADAGETRKSTSKWDGLLGKTKRKLSVAPDYGEMKRVDHDRFTVEYSLERHSPPSRDQMAIWAEPVELQFEYTFTGFMMVNLNGPEYEPDQYRFYRDRFAWCLADVKAVS